MISSHFILHQQALSPKPLHPYMQDMLDVVVEAVSLTEERALNHCMFNMLCKEVWSQHTILLLHTEILTRALVLQDLRCFCMKRDQFYTLQNRNLRFLCHNAQMCLNFKTH
jgi:hypothetical protein